MLGILLELKVENVEAGMFVEEMDLAGSASSSGQIVLKCFFSSPQILPQREAVEQYTSCILKVCQETKTPLV